MAALRPRRKPILTEVRGRGSLWPREGPESATASKVREEDAHVRFLEGKGKRQKRKTGSSASNRQIVTRKKDFRSIGKWGTLRGLKGGGGRRKDTKHSISAKAKLRQEKTRNLRNLQKEKAG